MWRLGAAAAVLAGAALAHGQDTIIQVDGHEDTDFGWSATSVGDVNDDGVPDIAVGAPDTPSDSWSYGAVLIYDGRTGDLLKTIRPRHSGWGFGQVVRLVGDFDHDPSGARDRNDLFIAAPGTSYTLDDPGYAVVISLDDILTADVTPPHDPPFLPPEDYAYTELMFLRGQSSVGDFGMTVASLGDTTGDGFPDIAVGEPGTWGANPGAVRVFSGADSDYRPELSMEDLSGGGNLGRSLCSLGDINGDGLGDYAAGAPFFDDGSSGGPGKLQGPNGTVNLGISNYGGPTVRYTIHGRPRRIGTTRTGGGLGAGLASGVVTRTGGRNLVVSGWGGGGYVQVHGLASISYVPSKSGGISYKPRLTPIAEYTGVGGSVALVPNCDGRSGLEVLVGGDDQLTLLSFGEKQPLQVFQVQAPAGEWFGAAYGYAGDLGNLDSRVPDGTSDLLIGSTAGNRAYVMPLPWVPAVLPQKVKLGAVFHTAAAAMNTKASGKLKTRIAKGTASFDFSFKKLPDGGPFTLFLETGPGSEKFVEVGTLGGTSGKIDLDGDGRLPDALGTRDLAELGGRVVELRDAADAVVLSTVLPYPDEPSKVKSQLTFETPAGAPYPAATVSATLSLVARSGADSLKLRVKGVPKSEPLELWAETKAGSGSFAKVADLKKGKLTLKSKSLEYLVDFPYADLQSLMERAAQIRDGSGQVVVYSVLASTHLPELRVSWVSLSYFEGPGGSFDTFTVSADVRNRGTADVGPVSLLAEVVFDDTIRRTGTSVTDVDLPAGERRDNQHVTNLDNPYPGQHPRVVVTVTVDPDSTGGSGQYVERREDNNSRTATFEWNAAEEDYERQ